jgi:WD40 repeat protein
MTVPSTGHSATLLQNGTIIVAGGSANGTLVIGQLSSENYDPTFGQFGTLAGSVMVTPRQNHTATLLTNGKVLVAGGEVITNTIPTTSSTIANAEILDPTALAAGSPNAWSATGSLVTARKNHTATLLQNRTILVTGGVTSTLQSALPINLAEIYNPSTGQWTATSNKMVSNRTGHTATLLQNGKVLLAGGDALGTAELYDPSTGQFTLTTGSMTATRGHHTATLLPSGKVLVVGGSSGTGISTAALSSADLYDPSTGLWTATGSLTDARENHTATLLPNGKVIVVGGDQAGVTVPALSSTEIFDPAGNSGAGSWSPGLPLNTARTSHSAVLLPGDIVVVIGGNNSGGPLNSAEEFDATAPTANAGIPMGGARQNYTMTVMPNSKILVAGGTSGGVALNAAEIYDPVAQTWTPAGATTNTALAVARSNHTAAVLPNGEVMLVGGQGSSGNPLNSTEIYIPSSDQWVVGPPMNDARTMHTMTVIPNGNLIVAGGLGAASTALNTAEQFNFNSNLWQRVFSMTTARYGHTATLIPGAPLTQSQPAILVTGGFTAPNTPTTSAELFDLQNNSWIATSTPMLFGRALHTASLLPNGNVLIVGGERGSPNGNGGAQADSEIFLFKNGVFTATVSLANAREAQSATVLQNGMVLVDGGVPGAGLAALSSAELFDPAASNTLTTTTPGNWSTVTIGGAGPAARSNDATALLPDGTVLLAGGTDGTNTLPSVDIYNQGLGVTSGQPVITSLPPIVPQAAGLVVGGTGFQGVSEASGGNSSQNAATNYPLLHFRTISNEQSAYILPANMSA